MGVRRLCYSREQQGVNGVLWTDLAANRRRNESHRALYVEYADPQREYGILFIFRLFSEYINLEYVRIHVICRVNLAEYAIRIPKAAPQEYVNI